MLPAATVISSGGTWRYGDKDLGAIETLSREISGRYAACHGRVGFCCSASVEMTTGKAVFLSFVFPFEMTVCCLPHRHLERRDMAVWG